MADWRAVMITSLISVCKARDIETFDADKVMEVLVELANVDRPKSSKDRIGYAWCIDNYKERGLKSLMTKTSKQWDAVADFAEACVVEKPKVLPNNACCISLLFQSRSERETMVDLLDKLQLYISDAVSFNVVIDAVFPMPHNWVDLRIYYAEQLLTVYSRLLNHPDVLDGYTKTMDVCGKQTSVTT